MEAKSKVDELVNLITDGMTEEDAALDIMSIDVSVAIASKRIDMGMTQKEFSKYMGVSQGAVSKWESGEANFTLKTLAQIAAKLGIKVRSPFIVERVPAFINHSENIIPFPGGGEWEVSAMSSNEDLKEM